VVWITVLPCTVELLDIRAPVSQERAEWTPFKGECLNFVRNYEGWPLNLPFVRRFKSLKFLLTNSKVPRDTKKLVAGVGEKKTNVGSSVIDLGYWLIEMISFGCAITVSGTRTCKWYPRRHSEDHR
jgi:hypothetical protein